MPTPTENVSSSPIISKKKLGVIALAHTALASIDFAFDNILYPAVLVWQGKMVGGVIMTLLSFLVCGSLVISYTRNKKDLLGVDVVEAVKERGEIWINRFYGTKGHWWLIVKGIAYIPSRIFLLVIWLLKKNDVTAFFALSIYQDAFKTTIFLRHGKTDALGARDWWIFAGSMIVSNAYWTLRWSLIIEIFKALF